MAEAEAVVDAFYAALNAHDPQAAVKLASEGVEVQAPGDLVIRGRDALVQLLETYLGAFPDLEWAIKKRAVDGDAIVTESVPEGTHRGPFRTPDGEIPPTGRRVVSRVSTCRGCRTAK